MKHTSLILLLLFLAVLLLVGSCSRTEAAPAPTEAAAEAVEVITTAPPETLPHTTLPPETEPPEETLLLTFVGDCTFGCVPEAWYAQMGFIKTIGQDYGYPFRNVLSYFENDEFTMVNLEGALTRDGVRQNKAYTFLGPPEYVNILTENSVEAVTLANNHSWDFGEFGYITTKNTLEEAGVPYVETNDIAAITTENGLTIGVYGTVYYNMDTEDMLSGIARLQELGVDLIVVAPHWGAEGYYQPNQTQIDYGHAAIDAGADIVYGSHPHVLQPIEYYGDGVIYYSLGNFSFGGNSAPDDFDTAIIQQEVIRDASGTVRLGHTHIIPACISSAGDWNNYQPTPYSEGGEAWNRVMDKLEGRYE